MLVCFAILLNLFIRSKSFLWIVWKYLYLGLCHLTVNKFAFLVNLDVLYFTFLTNIWFQLPVQYWIKMVKTGTLSLFLNLGKNVQSSLAKTTFIYGFSIHIFIKKQMFLSVTNFLRTFLFKCVMCKILLHAFSESIEIIVEGLFPSFY